MLPITSFSLFMKEAFSFCLISPHFLNFSFENLITKKDKIDKIIITYNE